jgi:hypothetical protein
VFELSGQVVVGRRALESFSGTVGKDKMMVVCRASPSSIMIQWPPLFPVFHNPGLFFKKEDFFPI